METEGYNVLSLFDGMSGGQIALVDLGIKINKYFSSEIDRYAIEQTQYNFVNTIQLGDVTQVRAKDLPKIDIIIGGSPCQGFSRAGKKLNFKDPRSILFFEFIRILKEAREINPEVKFLLENVEMKKAHIKIIIDHLGVWPVTINSALVSAQNRSRLYFSNIKTKKVGLFGDIYTAFEQPTDRKIYLKDILQPDNEINKKYYLKNKIDNHINYNLIQAGEINKICVAMRGRGPAGNIVQNIEPRTDNKTNTLTTVEKDNLVLVIPENTKKGFVEIKPGQCFDSERINNGTRRGRKMENKTNALKAKYNYFVKFTNDYKLRRLTPTECARLQTIPEWYKWKVSDTQQYKMLGNGWTVEIIKHIFNFLEK